MTKARGFTLVEVLVALAIVAVALAAVSRSVALSTDSAFEHKLRVGGNDQLEIFDFPGE